MQIPTQKVKTLNLIWEYKSEKVALIVQNM